MRGGHANDAEERDEMHIRRTKQVREYAERWRRGKRMEAIDKKPTGPHEIRTDSSPRPRRSRRSPPARTSCRSHFCIREETQNMAPGPGDIRLTLPYSPISPLTPISPSSFIDHSLSPHSSHKTFRYEEAMSKTRERWRRHWYLKWPEITS